MKRYIRTKYGEIIDLKYSLYTLPKLTIFNGQQAYYFQDCENGDGHYLTFDKIVKQADTIEELCDEFVKKSKEAWNNYFEIGEDDFVIFDRKYRKEDLEHYDYYGAIWTDKGLIYVAKMNKKGEMELL